MTRDDLDDLWAAIDQVPDALDLAFHYSGAELSNLGYELDQAAVALRNAVDNYADNVRSILNPRET